MLVSSPRPKHSVTGFPDKVGNVCYKVLQCPDALRHAKTRNSGQSQNTRYINKISTLWIIYHQKGLDEEIPKQQTKLRNIYSISRYKRNTTKMSKVLYHNSNKEWESVDSQNAYIGDLLDCWEPSKWNTVCTSSMPHLRKHFLDSTRCFGLRNRSGGLQIFEMSKF